MRCGWCETNNTKGGSCVNCGGPLREPGADPGPAPAPAPRALPTGFEQRLVRDGVRFGAAFGGVGVAVCALFVVMALFVPLLAVGLCIGGIFPVVGAGISYVGWRDANARLAVLRGGDVAPGRVTSVRPGSQPATWVLAYAYDVAGKPFTGELTSVDPNVTKLEAGFAMHVVHDPANPAKSDVWPLLA